ncbi:site-specific integrase [Nevskia sp.]|uniref:tyrosine-type recombinase/integrase n=1 Tax=Nevskia sp. TaxID=1929292 RepID=UPI0025DCDE27|nr:site-specific integrase [Nevskia sp.]
MAEKLLKDVRLRTARVVSGEELLADGNGLYLRVRPTGKDWQFIYSLNGKRAKQGLGSYPEVSLERARVKAAESRTLVADGLDPKTQLRAEKARRAAEQAAAARRHTVATLFEEWHRKDVSSRKDGGTEVRRSFMKDVLPKIGGLYADKVTRRHVVDVLDEVLERGVNRYANVLLQSLRQMFRFAALRDIVSGDPTFGLTKKLVGGAEDDRDRVLSVEELRLLASALPAAELTPQAQASVWIMLGALCRVGELSRARWADVDFDRGTWRIPAEHSKNGVEHLIHLSPFVVDQFQAIAAAVPPSEWVLPNRDGSGHLDTKALQRQFHDRQRQTPHQGRTKLGNALVMPGGDWRAHDLRRTGATLMGELGIHSDIIERCMNHLPASKMEKIYQRQQTLEERRIAFNRLGDWLSLIRDGRDSKVIVGRFGVSPTFDAAVP